MPKNRESSGTVEAPLPLTEIDGLALVSDQVEDPTLVQTPYRAVAPTGVVTIDRVAAIRQRSPDFTSTYVV